VFITLDSQLRRHRRKVALVLAVLGLSFAGLTAHSALMGSGVRGMAGTAMVCVAVGGCVAVITVAGFGVRRLAQRLLWLSSPPLAPTLRFTPFASGFLVRAGPPSLSQVFRL
jgi:hypothetical protein